MGTLISSNRQRAEIEVVLASGLFAKAPRLEKFFRHICERHLEGGASPIKEYSIATEALGRGSEFDPKTDSIVRVEAHRLRKRLEAYYAGEGAGHPVQISIPNGQYRLCFTGESESVTPAVEGACPVAAGPEAAGAAKPAMERPGKRQQAGWRWLAGAAAAATLMGTLALGVQHKRKEQKPALAGQEAWAAPESGFAMPAEFRMLAGYHGKPVLDRQGHTWLPDSFYNGGISQPVRSDKLGRSQTDAQFIHNERAGKFEYAIPLRPTTHELHIYMFEAEDEHANTAGGGESSHLMQVFINGELKLDNFDAIAEAGGPDRMYIRVFKDVRPGPDGKLRLRFQPLIGAAFLNALEILPSQAGRIAPVRIVAQENAVTDAEGRLWAADRYFTGGYQVFRKNVLENCSDIFYQGERYGNFSYRIPLAKGKYRLTLHFAETWFGNPESKLPPFNQRIFNVFANGVALVRDLDVAREASGPNRRLEKVFEGMEPNAQGILLIDFVPVKNYAEVNAIEVVETS